ncbi:MAG TPA: GIY-YIG nuclease family protein [Candidatus Paceibacterota bacterium]
MPYHVYILKCSDNSLYTGITTNLEKRLREHNGLALGGAKYTRAHRPVELVYVEKYPTRSEALKREHEIKNTLNHQGKLDLINKASKEEILNAI